MRAQKERPRIVVVDDERDFLEIMRESLSSRYDVECFSNPVGILDELSALEPDLLIFDLNMPEMNGIRLCEQVRQDPRLADTPVLFLTHSRTNEDFIQTLEVGANAFLNKPLRQRDLHARIQEVLAQR